MEIQENLLQNESESQTFLLAEYNTLRTEILDRIQLQEKAISLTLIVFGTVVSFGLQNHSPSIILLYPIISTFLTSTWAHNTISTKIIANYIRDEIENKIEKKNNGWENRSSTPFRRPLATLFFLSVYGVFLGAPIAAILVTLLSFPGRFSTIEIFLLILAFLCTICSSIIIVLTKPPHT